MILQPRVITDSYSVCSIINTHLNAIKMSQRQLIEEMTKNIKDFFEAEFYKPLKQLQSQVVQQNNNYATS